MAEKKLKKNQKKGSGPETDAKERETEEEAPQGEGNISEGVLDAFDTEDPEAGIEDDEVFGGAGEDDEELDSVDFRMHEEW